MSCTFTDEYNEWNAVTGALPEGTSCDFEIESMFEDADKRVSELEQIIFGMTNWLLKYQPDVFMRGLLYEMGSPGNATAQGETPSKPGERCEPGVSDGDSACPPGLPSSHSSGGAV